MLQDFRFNFIVDCIESMASEIRYRRSRTVSDTAFAGRLGGNQGFTVTDENEKGEELLKKQPDAV